MRNPEDGNDKIKLAARVDGINIVYETTIEGKHISYAARAPQAQHDPSFVAMLMIQYLEQEHKIHLTEPQKVQLEQEIIDGADKYPTKF